MKWLKSRSEADEYSWKMDQFSEALAKALESKGFFFPLMPSLEGWRDSPDGNGTKVYIQQWGNILLFKGPQFQPEKRIKEETLSFTETTPVQPIADYIDKW